MPVVVIVKISEPFIFLFAYNKLLFTKDLVLDRKKMICPCKERSSRLVIAS